MNDTSLTFRRCLLLCLPALIIGGALRISMLAALPEGGQAEEHAAAEGECCLVHWVRRILKNRTASATATAPSSGKIASIHSTGYT